MNLSEMPRYENALVQVRLGSTGLVEDIKAQNMTLSRQFVYRFTGKPITTFADAISVRTYEFGWYVTKHEYSPTQISLWCRRIIDVLCAHIESFKITHLEGDASPKEIENLQNLVKGKTLDKDTTGIFIDHHWTKVIDIGANTLQTAVFKNTPAFFTRVSL